MVLLKKNLLTYFFHIVSFHNRKPPITSYTELRKIIECVKKLQPRAPSLWLKKVQSQYLKNLLENDVQGVLVTFGEFREPPMLGTQVPHDREFLETSANFHFDATRSFHPKEGKVKS